MSLAEKQAEQKQAVIDYMRLLPVNKYAAANARITVQTLARWLKEDKEFLHNFEEAKSTFFKAKGAKAKPEFLLERLDRDTFGDKKEINNINVFAEIIAKYGGAVEGVIDEVPRPEEITEATSEDSA